jgi:pyruvate/2-oxoglutarate dehydrogenase complex dihydrolipoamide dehydrogenase (E3) component
MDVKDFAPDLVVIGGGMGGISTTVRSRRLGARVLLVEPEALGGT